MLRTRRQTAKDFADPNSAFPGCRRASLCSFGKGRLDQNLDGRLLNLGVGWIQAAIHRLLEDLCPMLAAMVPNNLQEGPCTGFPARQVCAKAQTLQSCIERRCFFGAHIQLLRSQHDPCR